MMVALHYRTTVTVYSRAAELSSTTTSYVRTKRGGTVKGKQLNLARVLKNTHLVEANML